MAPKVRARASPDANESIRAGMLPSEPFIAWLFELVPWMHRSLGLVPSTMVFPVDDDFPIDSTLEGEDLAVDWLGFVLEHAGMSDWDIGVRLEEEIGAAAALRGMPHGVTSPLEGSASRPIVPGEPLPITCTRALLREPDRLVAHFARGLAHYRVHRATTRSPGGGEMREAAIDVVSVFSGFGVFVANTRRQVVDARHLGFLGPIEVSYALALHATLTRASEKEITPHLRENPRAFFREGLRDLKKRPLERIATTSPYR